MYKINHIKNSKNNEDYLLIEDSLKTSRAKIYLIQGASLQELTLNSHELIKDLHPLTYDKPTLLQFYFPLLIE